jgi:beta-glucosidase
MPGRGASPETIRDYVDWCLGELSLEEKVWMMSGHGFLDRYVADGGEYNISPYVTGGGNERLGLPELLFTDGPRGVALGHSTCFPAAIARGASWDIELEERIGDAVGREVRAHGANFFGGICINVLRHPGWGRAQETYGEDPWLLGEMGAAAVRGVQHHNVVATIKHLACNSVENTRFKIDVRIGERALREVYLPHFKRCVDAGVWSVMSAYNKVNGAYCGHNTVLLRRILKEEWGFEGFVHSDFVLGVYGPDAAEAGLDIENPEPIHFGPKLVEAVESGEVSAENIDDSVRRILTRLLLLAAAEDPESYDASSIACSAHRELAREAAEKGAVLLHNRDDLLPLAAERIERLAVVGPLAATASLGDEGSSYVRPPHAVTPLDGLREYLGDRCEVVHHDGADVFAAADAVRGATAAVVVVGYTHKDEGEFIPTDMSLSEDPNAKPKGGDRRRLTLSEADEGLIQAVAATGVPMIVVMIGGSAILMDRWSDQADAVLMLWYPGMEGGAALPRLLFGDVSPSGRLPFSIPASADHLPFFDPDTEQIDYDLYHGYTLLDRDGHAPAYPFGYGLSYTTFEYGPVQCEPGQQGPELSCRITNTGERAGREIVQLYVGFERSRIDRPRKLLRGFECIALEPGQSVDVCFEVDPDSLRYFDEGLGRWVLEDIRYTAWIAPNSRVDELPSVEFEVPVR